MYLYKLAGVGKFYLKTCIYTLIVHHGDVRCRRIDLRLIDFNLGKVMLISGEYECPNLNPNPHSRTTKLCVQRGIAVAHHCFI